MVEQPSSKTLVERLRVSFFEPLNAGDAAAAMHEAAKEIERLQRECSAYKESADMWRNEHTKVEVERDLLEQRVSDEPAAARAVDIVDVNGKWLYAPHGPNGTKLSAHQVRCIADELDLRTGIALPPSATRCYCGAQAWPDDCVQIEDSRGGLHSLHGCNSGAPETKSERCPVIDAPHAVVDGVCTHCRVPVETDEPLACPECHGKGCDLCYTR